MQTTIDAFHKKGRTLFDWQKKFNEGGKIPEALNEKWQVPLKLDTECILQYPENIMKGYPSLTPEQKREIIARIKKKGERVADLAKEYGVSPRIIYGHLSRSGQHSGTILELSRLKREKDALLKIVGQLIVDQKLGKKIQHRYGN